MESCASGLVAGINAARLFKGQETVAFPLETAVGGLENYITTANPRTFQPMNINFSLLPGLGEKVKDKKEKNRRITERALAVLSAFQMTLIEG